MRRGGDRRRRCGTGQSVPSRAGMGTATDELELAAKAAADAGGTVFNQHQSYYHVDTETDDKRHGCHAIVHLEDIGVLDKNCLFAHMNVIRGWVLLVM